MSNLKTITQFKSALRGGGARPNLFEVNMTTWPGSSSMGSFNAAAQGGCSDAAENHQLVAYQKRN